MILRNGIRAVWLGVAGSIAFSTVALALIEGHTGIGVAHAQGKCRGVSGSISASVVTNPGVSTGLALGTVTGNLGGATMATFAASPGNSGNLNLALHHNFVTDSRDTLATEDTGTLIPVPGLTNVFRMSVDYKITGGTGKFAHATGTLHNHGEADLSRGELTLGYSGEVCTEE